MHFPESPQIIDCFRQRLVRIKDLLMSLSKLKDVADDVKSKRIEEVLHAMDVDTDGKVDVNLALEVRIHFIARKRVAAFRYSS